VYSSLTRIWPEMPLYLETDAFLDYLFHHEGQPSHEFTKMPPRELTSTQQASEIRRYALKFQAWAKTRNADRERHLSNARTIHRLLLPKRIKELGPSDILSVASRLNCMGDRRVLDRFINHPRNSSANVRIAWSTLLHGHHGALPTDEILGDHFKTGQS